MTAEQKDFIKNVNEEIEFLGWSLGDLAESTYISYERLKNVMRGTRFFNDDEIKVIKKRLGIE